MALSSMTVFTVLVLALVCGAAAADPAPALPIPSIASLVGQASAAVGPAAAQLDGLPGLATDAKAAVARLNKPGSDLLSSAIAKLAAFPPPGNFTGKVFKAPAAEAQLTQLLADWQKSAGAVVQSLAANITAAAGKPVPVSKDAYLAKIDTATKKLQQGVAAIPGVSAQEKTAALGTVQAYAARVRATLDTSIQQLLSTVSGAASAKVSKALPAPKPRRLLWWA